MGRGAHSYGNAEDQIINDIPQLQVVRTSAERTPPLHANNHMTFTKLHSHLDCCKSKIISWTSVVRLK